MIFLSHNHNDKELVSTMAERLSTVFGQDKIFYDDWSIQPGDGIIDKMNEGLASCKYFFFFVSKNSLSSKMVELEWQNALLKATKGQVKLIPVKIDDCLMPDILLQTLYVDVFGKGLENGLRQMIDVVRGINTYRSGPQVYENIRGYIKKDGGAINIEFRAESYLEPQSRYIILLDNKKDDFEVKYPNEGMTQGGFSEGVKLNNGLITNALSVSISRSTSPGFPFIANLTPKDGKEIIIKGLMSAVSQNEYKFIPVQNA